MLEIANIVGYTVACGIGAKIVSIANEPQCKINAKSTVLDKALAMNVFAINLGSLGVIATSMFNIFKIVF